MVWLVFIHCDGSQVLRCNGVFVMRLSQSEFVTIKTLAMETTKLSFQIIHQYIIQKFCVPSEVTVVLNGGTVLQGLTTEREITELFTLGAMSFAQGLGDFHAQN